jgi:F-type H+-transporting ATPase subunit b
MITIDKTLVLHIINMIVLMYALNVVLYKPILDILEKRRAKIGSLNNDIEQFRQNAHQRQVELDKKMREASGRAKKALDGARAEAQTAGNEKLAAIRKEADEAKVKQLTDIRAQAQAASSDLQGKVAGFAQDMAAKILGRSLQA